MSPPGEGIDGLSYTPESDLDLDTTYYWKMRSYDGEEFGPFNGGTWDFTIDSSVAISATTDGVNFTTINPGTSDDTSDDSPGPFVLQNDGNCLINVSINATQLFEQSLLDTDAYRFKIANVTGEEGAFNWWGSLMSWTNMPTAAVVSIDSMVYDNSTDSAEVDILISALGYEPAGNKESTVVFEAEMVE